MKKLLARTTKVLVYTKEEFIEEVKNFYKGVLDTNLDVNLNDGFGGIPSIILLKGFKNLSVKELIDVGDMYVRYLFDDYGYQFISVAVIFENGDTYFYDPKLNEGDACNYTNKAKEEIAPDTEGGMIALAPICPAS